MNPIEEKENLITLGKNINTTTKNTTGLLMEAMRLMDESSRDAVETQ